MIDEAQIRRANAIIAAAKAWVHFTPKAGDLEDLEEVLTQAVEDYEIHEEES